MEGLKYYSSSKIVDHLSVPHRLFQEATVDDLCYILRENDPENRGLLRRLESINGYTVIAFTKLIPRSPYDVCVTLIREKKELPILQTIDEVPDEIRRKYFYWLYRTIEAIRDVGKERGDSFTNLSMIQHIATNPTQNDQISKTGFEHMHFHVQGHNDELLKRYPGFKKITDPKVGRVIDRNMIHDSTVSIYYEFIRLYFPEAQFSKDKKSIILFPRELDFNLDYQEICKLADFMKYWRQIYNSITKALGFARDNTFVLFSQEDRINKIRELFEKDDHFTPLPIKTKRTLLALARKIKARSESDSEFYYGMYTTIGIDFNIGEKRRAIIIGPRTYVGSRHHWISTTSKVIVTKNKEALIHPSDKQVRHELQREIISKI